MDDHSSFLHDFLAGLSIDLREKTGSFLTLEDRETFPTSNQPFRVRAALIEARIRDYTELLKSKDREIELARGISEFSGPRGDSAQCRELQSRLFSLEEENKRLKALSPLKAEADALRRELDQVLRLKAAYEDKYNDVVIRLSTMDQSEDSSAMIDDDERRTDLAKKVDLFKHANEDLSEHIGELLREQEEIVKERDRLRDEVIPKLQSTIRDLEERNEEISEDLAEVKRTIEKGPPARESKISIPELELKSVVRTNALVSPSVSGHPSPFLSEQKWSPSRKNTVHSRKSMPAAHPTAEPKLGDKKKSVTKVQRVITSRPAGMRKQVTKLSTHHAEDQFADAFPDEEELEM